MLILMFQVIINKLRIGVLMGKSVEDIHLQQRQGHGRITIRQILRG